MPNSFCAAATHVSSSPPPSFPFTRFESSSAAAAVLLISFNECLRRNRKEGWEREIREIENGKIETEAIFTSASSATQPFPVNLVVSYANQW